MWINFNILKSLWSRTCHRTFNELSFEPGIVPYPPGIFAWNTYRISPYVFGDLDVKKKCAIQIHAKILYHLDFNQKRCWKWTRGDNKLKISWIQRGSIMVTFVSLILRNRDQTEYKKSEFILYESYACQWSPIRNRSGTPIKTPIYFPIFV